MSNLFLFYYYVCIKEIFTIAKTKIDFVITYMQMLYEYTLSTIL